MPSFMSSEQIGPRSISQLISRNSSLHPGDTSKRGASLLKLSLKDFIRVT